MTRTLHYFIYYRLREGGTDAWAREVAHLQSALKSRTGITGRLMRRADDPLTWMEVYEPVSDPAGFEAALADLLVLHDPAPFLAEGSTRKTERFIACA